jgi:hypothetical protein
MRIVPATHYDESTSQDPIRHRHLILLATLETRVAIPETGAALFF